MVSLKRGTPYSTFPSCPTRPSRSLVTLYSLLPGDRMESEVVEAAGHLIDSGLLNGIFDTVIRHGASFEVLRFTIGRTNAEPSLLSMRVNADSDVVLRDLIEDLVPFGCNVQSGQDVTLRTADLD